MYRLLGLVLIAGLCLPAVSCSDGAGRQDSTPAAPDWTASVKRYPVEELLQAALKRAEDMDPKARLVSLAFNAGNRDLAFASAGFVFNSPRLAESANTHASFSITIDEGMVAHRKTALEAWINGPQADVSPREVMAAALDTDLVLFLDRYPTSEIYMQLRPSAPSDKYSSTTDGWLWQVMGIGPGMTEVFLVYLDAGTLAVLGTRRKGVFSLN